VRRGLGVRAACALALLLLVVTPSVDMAAAAPDWVQGSGDSLRPVHWPLRIYPGGRILGSPAPEGRSVRLPADAAPNLVRDGRIGRSGRSRWHYFGWSVAISGNTIVVGAPFRHAQRGSAYVFTRAADGTWSQQAELGPSDRAACALFGLSVVVDGATAAVGAPGWRATHGVRGPGTAYVFRQGQGKRWSEVGRLKPSNGGAGDLFGYSVALAGAYVAVGAPIHRQDGAGYVFAPDAGGSYAEQAIVKPRISTKGGIFGYSIAALGGRLLVGAYGEDQGEGAAYLFTRTFPGSWVLSARLVAGDPSQNAFFGLSVALDETQILVGADGIGHGAAYVFGRAA
jgi:hypothetical protein